MRPPSPFALRASGKGLTARRRTVGGVRSEGDTWDITTSVGSTALFVATARALEAQKPDPLAVDPYAEIFCRAVGGTAADVLDGKDPDHQLKTTDFGENFVNFQGARTRYFDNYFARTATRACVRWSCWRRGWTRALPPGLAGRDHDLRARPAAGARLQA